MSNSSSSSISISSDSITYCPSGLIDQNRGHVLSYLHKAIKSLLEYKWPGNVRELENVMQRALVLCSNSKISELDIIVDSETNKVSVQENLREQILSKASLEEGVSNV